MRLPKIVSIETLFPNLNRAMLVASATSLFAIAGPGSLFAEDTESSGGSEAKAEKPCSSAEARELDFWIGEWDLTWEGGQGTNVVTAIMDGCVIQEQFDSGDAGFRGTSMSTYDARAGAWKQTWVDNTGSYLDFVGGMEDGKMSFSREVEIDGAPVFQRMVFYNIEENSIDWDWETSKDEGASWELQWRIHYERQSS